MAIHDFYGDEGNEKLLEMWAENPAIIGPSPGGAAAHLGVSRNMIYELARADRIDLYRVFRGRLSLRASEMYVSQESLDRFKQGVRSGEVPSRKIKRNLQPSQ